MWGVKRYWNLKVHFGMVSARRLTESARDGPRGFPSPCPLPSTSRGPARGVPWRSRMPSDSDRHSRQYGTARVYTHPHTCPHRPSPDPCAAPPAAHPAPHAPHASLRPTHLVFGVDVGLGGDERSHDIRLSITYSNVQGRRPILRRRVAGRPRSRQPAFIFLWK